MCRGQCAILFGAKFRRGIGERAFASRNSRGNGISLMKRMGKWLTAVAILFGAHTALSQGIPPTYGPGSGGGGGGITIGSPISGSCTPGFVIYNNSGVLGCEAVSGTGTVTIVSVATANGMGGTVATATTTPAITLTTSVNGIVKGNGTAFSVAAAGTDYLSPSGSGAALTGLLWSQIGSTPTTRAGYGITDAAKNGANSDITALSGLTTPLSVAQGGTGAATLTTGQLVQANGTAPLTTIAYGLTGNSTIVETTSSGAITPSLIRAFSDSGGTLITAASPTIPATYAIALFDPTSNAINAAIQGCNSGSGWDQWFKDATGQAATHIITLTPSAGTIDGAASAQIGSAYGALHIHSNGGICVIL